VFQNDQRDEVTTADERIASVLLDWFDGRRHDATLRAAMCDAFNSGVEHSAIVAEAANLLPESEIIAAIIRDQKVAVELD
jgi:hypothetical protein